MLKKLLIKKAAKRLMETPRQKKYRLNKQNKKRTKKQEHREWMIQRFGKVRYYLAYWLGSWILYI